MKTKRPLLHDDRGGTGGTPPVCLERILPTKEKESPWFLGRFSLQRGYERKAHNLLGQTIFLGGNSEGRFLRSPWVEKNLPERCSLFSLSQTYRLITFKLYKPLNDIFIKRFNTLFPFCKRGFFLKNELFHSNYFI